MLHFQKFTSSSEEWIKRCKDGGMRASEEANAHSTGQDREVAGQGLM